MASVDDETGRIVRLFHPRKDRWKRHFHLQGAVVIGRTATGRATVQLLQFNRPDRVLMRQALLEMGLYPP